MLSNIDAHEFIALRRTELLAEADQERLASQLPPNVLSSWRHDLAQVCYRLATWLDAPAEYVQLPEPGAEDWVSIQFGV